jgi:hypothetical protein
VKRRIKKIALIASAFMFVGQASASADFYGPFAPSAWTFSGDAAGNSLTASQMEIISKDDNPGELSRGTYTISVPGNTISISFDYYYVTDDVNGSYYDMAKYSIDGSLTNITTSVMNRNSGTTQSGTITLNNFSGNSFAIIQEAIDSRLGSATLQITNFYANLRYDDYLVGVSAPVLTVDSKGQASCTAGTYKFTSGPEASVNSFVYTLFVNNQPVSRMASDPTGAISSHMFAPITHSVQGAAVGNMATWDLSKQSNFDARCEVTVAKSGSVLTSHSNEFTDSVKIAAANAKAQTWEDQRSEATALNFTKEAREARKRAQARSGN